MKLITHVIVINATSLLSSYTFLFHTNIKIKSQIFILIIKDESKIMLHHLQSLGPIKQTNSVNQLRSNLSGKNDETNTKKIHHVYQENI